MPTISASDIFGSLFSYIDTLGNTIVQSLYQTLATSLAPVFWASAILWIAFWGYELAIGRVGITAGLFINRTIKLLVVYTFAFNWSTYSTWVVEGFDQIPDAIGSAVCQATNSQSCNGTASQGIASNLDAIWSAALQANQALMNASSWHSIGPALLAILIVIATAIMLAIASALIILAKVTMFLLLALAPIFVSMALFMTTSKVYDGWLTMLLQVGLVLPALVYGILGVMIAISQSTLQQLQTGSQNGNSPNMDMIGPYLLVILCTVFLLIRSENIAHAITGGARLGAYEAVRNTQRFFTNMATGNIGGAVDSAQQAIAGASNAQSGPRPPTDTNAQGRSQRTEAHIAAARGG